MLIQLSAGRMVWFHIYLMYHGLKLILKVIQNRIYKLSEILILVLETYVSE